MYSIKYVMRWEICHRIVKMNKYVDMDVLFVVFIFNR